MEKHFCDVCGKALDWNKKTSLKQCFVEELCVRYLYYNSMINIKVCAKCKLIIIKAIKERGGKHDD